MQLVRGTAQGHRLTQMLVGNFKNVKTMAEKEEVAI